MLRAGESLTTLCKSIDKVIKFKVQMDRIWIDLQISRQDDSNDLKYIEGAALHYLFKLGNLVDS